MAERIAFELNGKTRTVEVAPETPLLYVLRNEIGLSNPLFGCWSATMAPPPWASPASA
jgi:nicotinate dehydrogenase subunit A